MENLGTEDVGSSFFGLVANAKIVTNIKIIVLLVVVLNMMTIVTRASEDHDATIK